MVSVYIFSFFKSHSRYLKLSANQRFLKAIGTTHRAREGRFYVNGTKKVLRIRSLKILFLINISSPFMLFFK